MESLYLNLRIRHLPSIAQCTQGPFGVCYPWLNLECKFLGRVLINRHVAIMQLWNAGMLFNVHLSASFAVVSDWTLQQKLSAHFDCNFSKNMFKGTYLPQFKDLVCFGILFNVNQKLNIARIANLNQQKNWFKWWKSKDNPWEIAKVTK